MSWWGQFNWCSTNAKNGLRNFCSSSWKTYDNTIKSSKHFVDSEPQRLRFQDDPLCDRSKKRMGGFANSLTKNSHLRAVIKFSLFIVICSLTNEILHIILKLVSRNFLCLLMNRRQNNFKCSNFIVWRIRRHFGAFV